MYTRIVRLNLIIIAPEDKISQRTFCVMAQTYSL